MVSNLCQYGVDMVIECIWVYLMAIQDMMNDFFYILQIDIGFLLCVYYYQTRHLTFMSYKATKF
jgi:hypothetical protein